MKKFGWLIILLLLTGIIFGCGGSKAYNRPSLKSSGLVLAKKVEKQGDIGVPQGITTDFLPHDDEAVAYLKFENFSGKYLLRWDWHDPQGNLYYTTGNFPLKTNKGKYCKEYSVWHSLKIDGDKASEKPGQWMTKIYLNDDLIDYKTFTIQDLADPVALPQDLQPNPETGDWGLIIGIEQYAHLPQVAYARKDALQVKNYFLKVLGVPEENIIMLIDNHATKARIEGYLEYYLPEKVNKNNKIYVYFAGHGAPDLETGSPYLVPYDGDTRFLQKTGYKLRKMYADLDKLNVKQTYLFLDSCFSGMASRTSDMLYKGKRPGLIHVVNPKIKSGKVVAFSASSAGQTSNAYPQNRHGLFTYYLLKALQGEADSNADKGLSINEVYAYVSKEVAKTARRLGTEQTPKILPSLDQIKGIELSKVPSSI